MGNGQSSDHVNYTSRWYFSSEIHHLVAEAFPGDCIEFHRGAYMHWGIYVGYLEYEGYYDHWIIHTSSPPGTGSSNVFSSSASSHKAANNLGIVTCEPISEVISDKARINNSYDKTREPLNPEEVVSRAFQYIGSYDEYHLLKNNCEHFVHLCRNGKRESCQVDNALAGVVMTGILLTGFALIGAIKQ